VSETFSALRLQGAGAHALEIEGVARNFGALVAITGINMRVAAGERRAVLGSNGAGKTTLFNAITGDFMPTAGRIRFFGEDITDLPTHERIRRGLRRTYQISQLFRGLSVRDSVFLACRGVSRRRFSLIRPGWSDTAMAQADSILQAVHLEGIAARDRASAGRRAALHPVRRAGRRPVAHRAARPRRHSKRLAEAHRLHHH
jgi:branched-chain amino acid transport system ATP-binding protein